MLLILSNKTDHSTSAVIKWLLHYKTPFRRINGEDDLLGVNIIMNTNEGIRIVLNGQGNENYDLSHFESFWYRRGDLQIVTPVLSISQYAVINTLKREWHLLPVAFKKTFRKLIQGERPFEIAKFGCGEISRVAYSRYLCFI